MALKANPIWGCAKTPHFLKSLPDLVPNRCGFGLDLRVLSKWECSCVGVVAQTHRAITPVEDDRSYTPDIQSSEANERSQDSQSSGFHKDLNLLPSELIYNLCPPFVVNYEFYYVACHLIFPIKDHKPK